MKPSFVAGLASMVFFSALVVSPFVPRISSAETFILPTQTGACGFFANCTPGVLHVYVEALDRPSQDFTAVVSAQNSAPVSFVGSLSGTKLSVLGSYTVTVAPYVGYAANYSIGCAGSVALGSEATCVVSLRSTSSYFSAPRPYPYPYTMSQLGCVARYTTIGLGQTAVFDAVGGASGPFTWQTPERSYLNTGTRLSVAFSATGVKQVSVMSGTQTAVCTIEVVPNQVALPLGEATVYNAYNTYAAAPVYTPVAYYNSAAVAPAVAVTSVYIPRLPNTGFAPVSAAQIALAVAALISTALALLPYVRKSFAISLE